MRIAVIGTGYLGTTHAACMAHIGHNVLGVDIDPGKVAKLQSGEVPFYEPDVETIVRDTLAAGRLRFTDSYEEAADFADVHFLAVGTPQNETNLGANLSYLNAAIDTLSPHLNRPVLIVGSRPYRWAQQSVWHGVRGAWRLPVTNRTRLEPGVPPRRFCRARHPSP